MDYKNTLHLPKTEFSMKASLVNKEPVSRAKWDENKIYEKRVKKNKNNPQFILHDGPPYANGDLHVGHALNKILKDFVVRSKSMYGFYSPYIPGWDTHGLPIETVLAKKGVKRKELDIIDYRNLCRDYAYSQVDIQRESFKEYNILGDWDNPYITLEKDFEASQVEVFAKMVEIGMIFKGLRPVYWSPSSESALAEAEIEYKDKKSPSIYVEFPIDAKFQGHDNVSLVIWTTTPWTLPGNVAVCVSESIEYALVNFKDKKYILAKELVESLMAEFEIDEYEILETFKGEELKEITYNHPFLERKCRVISGEHVTLESGTALVHTAPGHGAEDFEVGKEYDLDTVCPVDERGVLTKEAGQFEGLFYDEANKKISMFLEEKGLLVKLTFITHSYPHDWRTKQPIIFRTTPQWFASIDGVRQDLLNAIENDVQWIPEWGMKRLYNMVQDRGDWCISRQRIWGVPIPIIYDENREEILDPELMRHFANVFRERGSNAWYELDVKDLLPKGYTHPGSPNGIYYKETDIMDVWFDSGTTHNYMKEKYGLNYPFQLYLEGNDQFRGWYNSSLITGQVMNNKPPYERVLTHGMILDGKGYAMSKSLGNTIAPKKILNQYGADILRLWVASVDYKQDAKISMDALAQVAESYKKLRNTFRFLDGNLSGFDCETDLVKFENLEPINQYFILKLNDLIAKCDSNFEKFEFQHIYKDIIQFCVADVSNFYFDYAKDSLYADSKDSQHRLGIQTVLFHLENSLIRLLTPFIPHTTEELYSVSDVFKNKEESVYLLDMPKAVAVVDVDLSSVELFFEIRKDVLKEMESLREQKEIGKSLEACLEIKCSEAIKTKLEQLGSLRELFISSDVTFVISDTDEFSVKASKAAGSICQRCWNVFDNIDELCPRCESVLNN